MPSTGYNADNETIETAENSSTASGDSRRTTQRMQSRNSSAASLLMAHHVQQGMPSLGNAPRQIDAAESYNIANDNNNDSDSGGGGTSSSNSISNSNSNSNSNSSSNSNSNNNNNRSLVFSVDLPPVYRDPLSQSNILNGYENRANTQNLRPAEDPRPSTGRSRSRRRGNRHITRTQQRRLCIIHTTLRRTARELSCIRNLLRQQLRVTRILLINHQSNTSITRP